MVPTMIMAGLLGVQAGSRRRQAARRRLLLAVIAVSLLPVLGLIGITITRVGGSDLTIGLCLSFAIAARGILCAAALMSLAFAARALRLPRAWILRAATIAIACSTALSVALVVGMAARIGMINSEFGLAVGECISAAILCAASIAAVELWRAITAKERALQVSLR